jgi:hypothetical protein
MTNPDERRGRLRVSIPTEGIIQPNFGAALAAQMPQVEMPTDWDAVRVFGMPVVGPVLAPVMGLGPIVAK